MTLREQIDEIDQLLFDAGVLVFAAKCNRDRKDADRKIMDARVKLQRLRANA